MHEYTSTLLGLRVQLREFKISQTDVLTFVIGNKPIFPISGPNQMRTRIHMLPIKYQSVQFTSRVLAKLQFFGTENCKQTDTSIFKSIEHGSKYPGL